jgi:ATP-dependent Lon protease
MIETNLPIIFLKEIIVFPYNEIKIEFTNNKDKLVIDKALKFNDGYMLLVNLTDPLEENPNYRDLPKIVILGKINSKIELPDGSIRVIIQGMDRVEVLNYLEGENNNLNAFVMATKEYDYDEAEANALKRILIRDLNDYIETSSYMSNSVLGKISGVDNISKLADIIIGELPLDYAFKLKYIGMSNPMNRVRSIIEDIHRELENIKLENDIESKLKEHLEDGQKEYVLREKIKIIKEELGESDLKERDINLLNSKIEQVDIPDNIKFRLQDEIKRYELAPPSSPDITIIRNYIDWLIALPWNVSTIDNYDLKEIRDSLNKSHYGLDEVKTRIIEYIAIKNHTDGINTPIICLVGPPGTGKTSIAKSIASAINKKFVKISVGGVNDEGEIKGHRRTYIGASPGKIIQGLKKAKVNNPLFLIDEIDKMTSNYKGDPASSLLDVLDKEQNNMFMDNYIEEEFDLSKVMFILTANNLENIPAPLRDRLEIIELSSYTNYEKLEIAKSYLIPRLSEEYNLDTFMITDEAIIKIIENYTRESGIRELDRQITKICRKIVVNKELGTGDFLIEVIDINNLEEYLGKEKYHNNSNDKNKKSGVVNTLGYTPFGGTVFKTSVSKCPGDGNIVVTGSIGEVMEESVKISLSYIKSNYSKFGIELEELSKNDFHIHFEDGSTPKDGPSAGITIVTTILSLIKNITIDNRISMTGEITLRGKILPVGGLKEKLIAAKINNIETIFLPSDNDYDLDNIPEEIKKDLEIILVNDYLEIYKYLFKSKDEKPTKNKRGT